MSEKVNQILHLLSENEEAAAAFEKVDSAEEAVALLNQHGVEITADEFAQCAKEFEDGEMSEEMLGMVSGGSLLGFAGIGLKALAEAAKRAAKSGIIGGPIKPWTSTKKKK